MKSSLIKLGVILIGLAIFSYTEVWGADWIYFGENSSGVCFYDATSITHPSKNIVRVWSKIIHSEEGKKNYIAQFGAKYNNLCFTKHFIEYQCREKKMRFLGSTPYNLNGTVIKTINPPNPKWYFIKPEALEEILYKMVCK